MNISVIERNRAYKEKGRKYDPFPNFSLIRNYFNTILLVKLTDLPATRTI